jgi:hypothetical protein
MRTEFLHAATHGVLHDLSVGEDDLETLPASTLELIDANERVVQDVEGAFGQSHSV